MRLKLLTNEPRRPRLAYSVLFATGALSVAFLYLTSRAANPVESQGFLATDSLVAVEAVHSFAAFAAEKQLPRDTTRLKAHAAEGLRLLGAAIYVVANREARARPTNHQSIGAELLEAALTIEEEGGGASQSAIAASALISAATALSDIQRLRYPQLRSAVVEVEKTASEFTAGADLASQLPVLQRFFDRASDALRAMVEVGV